MYFTTYVSLIFVKFFFPIHRQNFSSTKYFVILDIQTIFLTQVVSTFIIFRYTKFNIETCKYYMLNVMIPCLCCPSLCVVFMAIILITAQEMDVISRSLRQW
jgi:hypothetical protein